MANQMTDTTPPAMRLEAFRLRAVSVANAEHGWENNADSCRAGADALDRLADVIEYAESVMRERSDTIARGMRVGTAETFLDIARGETNERGDHDEPLRTPQPCTICGTNGGFSPWHREDRCVNHLQRDGVAMNTCAFGHSFVYSNGRVICAWCGSPPLADIPTFATHNTNTTRAES